MRVQRWGRLLLPRLGLRRDSLRRDSLRLPSSPRSTGCLLRHPTRLPRRPEHCRRWPSGLGVGSWCRSYTRRPGLRGAQLECRGRKYPSSVNSDGTGNDAFLPIPVRNRNRSQMALIFSKTAAARRRAATPLSPKRVPRLRCSWAHAPHAAPSFATGQARTPGDGCEDQVTG